MKDWAYFSRFLIDLEGQLSGWCNDQGVWQQLSSLVDHNIVCNETALVDEIQNGHQKCSCLTRTYLNEGNILISITPWICQLWTVFLFCFLFSWSAGSEQWFHASQKTGQSTRANKSPVSSFQEKNTTTNKQNSSWLF